MGKLNVRIIVLNQTSDRIVLFSAGGFYQDEFAYTGRLSHGMGCKLCPLGHFVPPHAAPGKAITECILCPQGWYQNR